MPEYLSLVDASLKGTNFKCLQWRIKRKQNKEKKKEIKGSRPLIWIQGLGFDIDILSFLRLNEKTGILIWKAKHAWMKFSMGMHAFPNAKFIWINWLTLA